MYQGPWFMSFGRYFVSFCLVFLAVMYLGDFYLVFGWYSVGGIVSFTCVLSFGYCHVDFLTPPVYHPYFISVSSYCYSLVRRSLPVTCVAHPVETGVSRTRSSSSRRMQVMEIWLCVIDQWEQTYRELSVRLARSTLGRFGWKSSSSGNKVTESSIKVFVQEEQSYGHLDHSVRPAGTKLRRLEFQL